MPTCTRDNAARVRQTDAVGNKVVVLHYEWDGKRVREWPDGSMLVELRAGRFRNFQPEHWLAKTIRGEQSSLPAALDTPLARKLAAIERARRHSPGTHEAFTYYVDRDGKIGIPPQGVGTGLEIPDNVTVHTANTLADADRLCATMRDQMYRDFQDEGVATEFFDKLVGFDRDEIVRAIANSPTAKGREISRLMLQDLDREQEDRQRISTNAYFRWREYDGG